MCANYDNTQVMILKSTKLGEVFHFEDQIFKIHLTFSDSFVIRL